MVFLKKKWDFLPLFSKGEKEKSPSFPLFFGLLKSSIDDDTWGSTTPLFLLGQNVRNCLIFSTWKDVILDDIQLSTSI